MAKFLTRLTGGVRRFLRRPGKKYARTGCRPACCGVARYVKAVDCCDHNHIAWFSTTAHCTGGDPIWTQNGPPTLINIGGGSDPQSVCWLTIPNIVKTLAEILADDPSPTIYDEPVGGWDCRGNACAGTPVCPGCPQCCASGTVSTCEVDGQTDPGHCCECGSHFTLYFLALGYRDDFQRDAVGFTAAQTPDPCAGGAVRDWCHIPVSEKFVIRNVTARLEFTFEYRCNQNQTWEVLCNNYSATVNDTRLNYAPEPWASDPSICPPCDGYTPTRLQDDVTTTEENCANRSIDLSPESACAMDSTLAQSLFDTFFPSQFPTRAPLCSGHVINTFGNGSPGPCADFPDQCWGHRATPPATEDDYWQWTIRCRYGSMVNRYSYDSGGAQPNYAISRSLYWSIDPIQSCAIPPCPNEPPPVPIKQEMPDDFNLIRPAAMGISSGSLI